MIGVLVLHQDRFYARALEQCVNRVLPGENVQVVKNLAEGTALLAEFSVELLITGLTAPDGDVLGDLAEWTHIRRRVKQVLVVNSFREIHLLSMLEALCVTGVYDALSEDPAAFDDALRLVRAGSQYRSPSLIDVLVRHNCRRDGSSFLTLTEKIALAVIGDGCDDAEASKILKLRESTIRNYRENIHRKLGIRQKGELVRAASELGFVRINAQGVERPGLALLMKSKSQRKTQAAVA